jgi:hypothetical protein
MVTSAVPVETRLAVGAALISELEDQVERLLACRNSARANPARRSAVTAQAQRIAPVLEAVLLHGLQAGLQQCAVFLVYFLWYLLLTIICMIYRFDV